MSGENWGGTVEFAGGVFSVDWVLAGRAEFAFDVYYYPGDGGGEELLASDRLAVRNLTDRTKTNRFLNVVRDGVPDDVPIDGDQVKHEMREWFDALHDDAVAENEEFLLSDELHALDEAVDEPIEVYMRDRTTEVHVTAVYNGMKRTMEFDAVTMASDDETGPINSALANLFLEWGVEVTEEQWRILRTRWTDGDRTVVKHIQTPTEAGVKQ